MINLLSVIIFLALSHFCAPTRFASDYNPRAMVEEGDRLVNKDPLKSLEFYKKAYYARFPTQDIERALANAFHKAIQDAVRQDKFEEGDALAIEAKNFPLPNLHHFTRHQMVIAFQLQDYNRTVLNAKEVLRVAPNEPDAYFWAGRAYNKLKAYNKSIPYLTKVPQTFGGYRSALVLLGQAYYHTSQHEEAIKVLTQALNIEKTDDVQSYLDGKVKKDYEIEKNYITSLPTPHFRIKSSEEKLDEVYGILKPILERIYIDLTETFLFYPVVPINVVIYDPEQQAFNARLGNPQWAAGVYDGQIKLPYKEVKQDEYQLETILRHEMVHLFVDSFTRNVIPTWLNEGLAQYFEKPLIYEGKDSFTSREEAPLPRGFRDLITKSIKNKKLIPMKELTGSFMGFQVERARLAYAQSLMMARYLTELLGNWRMRRMLADIYDGALFPVAFKKETGMTVDEFTKVWLVHQKQQWKIQ